jgi:thiamine biosynthesis lipoprotein
MQLLIDNGYTGGYINIGGSSIYVLDFKDGLSIKHPRKTGENILKVNANIIKNSPLSTSGDYVRYYLDNNGNRYSHFIDVATGKPSNTGFSSITVIANGADEKSTATFTDMLSTALMLMQKQELIDFVNTHLSNFTIFAVNDEEIITNADKKDFTLIDANYKINFI